MKRKTAKNRVRSKAPGTKNSKHEIRNPKQIQMFKKTKNSKQFQIGFEVLDFPGLGFISAPVCFEFRYSDFGFYRAGELGAIIFLQLVLFNNLPVSILK
jgi:hypothetical protein